MSNPLLRLAARALAPCALLATAAEAEGVRIVAPNPGSISYATVQEAVDAAQEGDVLMLGGGSYPGFVIDGKSLTLVRPLGPAATITGGVVVRNLAAGQAVTLVRLDVQAASAGWGNYALRVEQCLGDVRAQESAFRGRKGSNSTNWHGGDGSSGVFVEGSQRVLLTQCSLLGGGGGTAGYDPTKLTYGGDGGYGIFVHSGSWVVLDGSVIKGGKGGDDVSFGLTFAGDGGTAALGNPNATLQIGGATLTAGQAGSGPGGTDGYALALFSGAIAYDLDATLNGPVAGTLTPFPASTFRLVTTGQRVVSDQQPWQLGVTGIAGDTVFLGTSTAAGFRFSFAASGVFLPGHPSTITPLGALTATGSAQAFSVPLAPVGGGAAGRFEHAQVLIRELAGTRVLSGYAPLLVLDEDGGPDCDGSGVNDLLEILAGTLPDANGNLIPDSCPGG